MLAGTLNITLDGGATFTCAFTALDGGARVDLSAYTVRFQVRRTAGASSPVLLDLDSVTTPAAVSVGGTNNATVELTLTDEQTADLPAQCYYGLGIESALGDVDIMLRGALTVRPVVVG
jgi:hypothetical protein